MAKEMTLREVQLSCLDIMKAFDAFCKENKLTYYLSGGTLLGAVRHQGFIPWDDDVDLMMPREDYQRMLTLDFPDPNYGFFCLEKMADYSRPWVRMTDKRTVISGMAHYSGDTQAICIDIFPIDGVPPAGWPPSCFSSASASTMRSVNPPSATIPPRASASAA